MSNTKSFLTESELRAPIVLGPGAGKVVGVLGARSTFKVLSDETGGAYALIEQEVPPGSGPPLHVHHHETEIFYLLEGELEVTLGKEKIAAPAGATVVAPRDIPHKFRNVGHAPAKLLVTVIPGRFANYFLEVDSAQERDLATIKTYCAKYDVDILE
jgi:quercetin dioxygenase-like cupin family protein